MVLVLLPHVTVDWHQQLPKLPMLLIVVDKKRFVLIITSIAVCELLVKDVLQAT